MKIHGVSLTTRSAWAVLATFTTFILVAAPAHTEQDTKNETEAKSQVLNEQVIASPDSGWVDSSHRFATDQTMALTRWVDSFFGDVEGDAETAESQLRVKISTQWDERFPNQNRVTVGGKIDLPRLANRVDLVFRGDDPDELIRGDQN
ncbi:MAG: hypothetical protein VW491_11875, partial [Gammaproteobacteria bacterium]